MAREPKAPAHLCPNGRPCADECDKTRSDPILRATAAIPADAIFWLDPRQKEIGPPPAFPDQPGLTAELAGKLDPSAVEAAQWLASGDAVACLLFGYQDHPVIAELERWGMELAEATLTLGDCAATCAWVVLYWLPRAPLGAGKAWRKALPSEGSL